MKKEEYSFGKMKIDGETYTSDLVIYPDKIKENWIRKKGHILNKEDIEDIIEYKPDVLIVGTGAYGVMKIPIGTKKYIQKKGIELIEDKTKKAAKRYNELKEKNGKVIAGFHLTC